MIVGRLGPAAFVTGGGPAEHRRFLDGLARRHCGLFEGSDACACACDQLTQTGEATIQLMQQPLSRGIMVEQAPLDTLDLSFKQRQPATAQLSSGEGDLLSAFFGEALQASSPVRQEVKQSSAHLELGQGMERGMIGMRQPPCAPCHRFEQEATGLKPFFAQVSVYTRVREGSIWGHHRLFWQPDKAERQARIRPQHVGHIHQGVEAWAGIPRQQMHFHADLGSSKGLEGPGQHSLAGFGADLLGLRKLPTMPQHHMDHTGLLKLLNPLGGHFIGVQLEQEGHAAGLKPLYHSGELCRPIRFVLRIHPQRIGRLKHKDARPLPMALLKIPAEPIRPHRAEGELLRLRLTGGAAWTSCGTPQAREQWGDLML